MSGDENLEFDYLPVLGVEARAICFSIDGYLNKNIRRLRSPTNKVGFFITVCVF